MIGMTEIYVTIVFWVAVIFTLGRTVFERDLLWKHPYLFAAGLIVVVALVVWGWIHDRKANAAAAVLERARRQRHDKAVADLRARGHFVLANRLASSDKRWMFVEEFIPHCMDIYNECKGRHPLFAERIRIAYGLSPQTKIDK